MGSGVDATYQTDNYEEQGGARTVIGGELDVVSGGSIDLESGGNIDVLSGAAIDIASGGDISVASGGTITMASGGAIAVAVQTLGSSQVATNITGEGITTITATTTAPAYTMDAPVTGVQKIIACTANTSSGTAVINSNSTGVSFTSSGDNEMTMNAIGDRVILAALSTTAWIIASNVGSVATGTQTT